MQCDSRWVEPGPTKGLAERFCAWMKNQVGVLKYITGASVRPAQEAVHFMGTSWHGPKNLRGRGLGDAGASKTRSECKT